MVERDRDLMAEVIGGDEAINRLHLEIDDRCFKLLALRQPMAVDLADRSWRRSRSTATSSGSATSRSTSPRRPSATSVIRPVKPLIDLPRMGDMAQRMLHEALHAFVAGDCRGGAASSSSRTMGWTR